MGTFITRAARRTLLVGVIVTLAACSGAATGTATPGTSAVPIATAAPASAAPAPSPAPAPAGSKDLILATTTSTQDSGLLDVLVPAFQAATGYQVKTVAVGSGAARKLGTEGTADA